MIRFLLCLLILTGCARRGPKPESFAARGLKVGRIDVRLESGTIDAERLDVFNKMNGLQRLENQMLEKLKAHNFYDPSSPVELRLAVNSFRLRHGATRFFTGLYSGTDNVGARVDLSQKRKPLLSVDAEVSGGNGNMFNISRESRGSALFDSLAKRIVVLLTQEKLL